MLKPIHISLLFFIFLSTFSCGGGNSTNTGGDLTVKPKGSDKAVPVYNQAYQENFEADKIADIIANAKGAYVLLDPFLEGVAEAIPQIKANGNEIGGYISIGTGEDYRADFDDLKPFLVTKVWDKWEGEYFVNETTTGIIPILKLRIDKLAAMGCDWVEFDNMDWAFDDGNRAEYGFKVTQAEAIAFYQELCDYVHQKGMKCMAKNTVQEATGFDGVLYESYNDEKNWWDVDEAQAFLNLGKLVIINHYNENSCNQVYTDYMNIYNNNLSYICESTDLKKYIHYNE